MMLTGFFSLRYGCFRRALPAIFLTCAGLLVSTACIAQDGGANSDEAIAYFNQGQDAHEKGNLVEAINLYQKAIEILPEFPEAEFQKGNALLSLGKLDESEAAFRRAVKLKEDWSLALANLGNVLVKRAKYDEALPVLQRSISIDEQNFPAQSFLTELLLKTNAGKDRLNSQLAVIKQLTSKANPTASIWASQAALENAIGNKAVAKTSLDKALEIDPRNSNALLQRAEISLAEGDAKTAENYVDKLGKAGYSENDIKFLRARILIQQNNISEALKLLESVKQPSAEALRLTESIRARLTENPADLEKLLEKNPKDTAILGRLCSMLRLSDPQKALDYCRRASASEPQNIAYAVGYGAALVQARQYADAAVILSKLASLSPDNSAIHANLATALFQLKRYAEAKVEFQWLIERQPDLAGAYYFLGICHDQLGEYPEAQINYNAFLRIADPKENQLEIEKVNLRLPLLEKLVKQNGGKRND